MKHMSLILFSLVTLTLAGCQSNESSNQTTSKKEVATPVAKKTVEPVKKSEATPTVVVEKPKPVVETVKVEKPEPIVEIKKVATPKATEAQETKATPDSLPTKARKRYDRYVNWGNATPEQETLIYEELIKWLDDLEVLEARTDLSASAMVTETKILYRKGHQKIMRSILTEEQREAYINR